MQNCTFYDKKNGFVILFLKFDNPVCDINEGCMHFT